VSVCSKELAKLNGVFVFILDIILVNSVASVDTAGRSNFAADGLLGGGVGNTFTGRVKLLDVQRRDRRSGPGFKLIPGTEVDRMVNGRLDSRNVVSIASGSPLLKGCSVGQGEQRRGSGDKEGGEMHIERLRS